EEVAEAMRFQRIGPGDVVIPVTQFGIDRAVVTDVVSVPAAGPRPQIRRRVTGPHAELREIRRNLRRLAKGEARLELNAVGADGSLNGRPAHGASDFSSKSCARARWCAVCYNSKRACRHAPAPHRCGAST